MFVNLLSGGCTACALFLDGCRATFALFLLATAPYSFASVRPLAILSVHLVINTAVPRATGNQRFHGRLRLASFKRHILGDPGPPRYPFLGLLPVRAIVVLRVRLLPASLFMTMPLAMLSAHVVSAT